MFAFHKYQGAGNDFIMIDAGRGPVLLDTVTYRFAGHSPSDASAYRTKEEMDLWRQHDSLIGYRAYLVESGFASDADLDAISRVPDVGANRIELYTGPFADAVAHHGPDAAAALESLDRYRAAAEHARALGLGVNAGHDLNLLNLPLLATVDAVLEVSIGHALIADALYLGLERTVAAYLRALGRD